MPSTSRETKPEEKTLPPALNIPETDWAALQAPHSEPQVIKEPTPQLKELLDLLSLSEYDRNKFIAQLFMERLKIQESTVQVFKRESTENPLVLSKRDDQELERLRSVVIALRLQEDASSPGASNPIAIPVGYKQQDIFHVSEQTANTLTALQIEATLKFWNTITEELTPILHLVQGWIPPRAPLANMIQTFGRGGSGPEIQGFGKGPGRWDLRLNLCNLVEANDPIFDLKENEVGIALYESSSVTGYKIDLNSMTLLEEKCLWH